MADIDRAPWWTTRSGYAVVAAAWALFVAYGSLVPFDFSGVSPSAALSRFSAATTLPLHIDSRTDFATNILLGVPLGYLTLAALATDRRRWSQLLAVPVAVSACALFSIAVEFAQVFFPGRTDSLSDIVAQCAGACLGVFTGVVAGGVVTPWLRGSLRERERGALFHRVLLGYVVVFALSQVMPLDLTLNLGELAAKYRDGRVLIVPLSYTYANAFDMAWDLIGDTVLNVPIGLASALLWTSTHERRRIGVSLMVAIGAVVAIELLQVLVNSRVADTTDVITGSIGAAIGVFSARVGSGAAPVGANPVPHDRAWPFLLGVMAWIVALLSYHWNPFDFTTESGRVVAGMHQLMDVPFHSYYQSTEFTALTQILRKSVLAAPLGILLRLSLGRQRSSRVTLAFAAAIGFVVLVAIEIGQVFLPSRVPDMTDPMVGEAGIIAAMWLTGRFLSARSGGPEWSASQRMSGVDAAPH